MKGRRAKGQCPTPACSTTCDCVPPNTLVHLVPRMLPTTSQVNIGLYVITQLFWDFKKTCKKRITPTGITEGERGFEQTKQCYLTEVIPFFNLLKEHFDEVQKSMVTEVRVMKAIFENLEAEVDQNEIDLKSDVFYTVTDSALNAYAFHDLSIAYNVAMTRVGQRNTIQKLKAQISQSKANKSDELRTLDSKSLDSQNLRLKETVIALQERLENFKAKNEKVKRHYQELFDSIKITRAKTIEKTRISTTSTARRSQLKSHIMHDKTLPADGVTKMKVEEHPRKNKSKLSKMNRVDSSTSVRHAATGRLIPLGGQCPLVRPTTPTNSLTPVEPNLVYSNQQDPNCNWGSNL
ncbi:hypothetical protein Tco_1367275, partial [Tanacetum coccineum]